MDKPPKKTASFVSRNLVTIVMVPAIIALHIGWNSMQNNRSLVHADEQIDLPIVTFYKYCVKKLSGETPSSTVSTINGEKP